MRLARFSTAFLLMNLLAACEDKEEDTSEGANTGEDSGDTTAGDSGDTTGDACTALQEGRWSTTGACFGMPMDAEVTMDVDNCAFTFSDWNMAMSVPDGGTIAGDTLTFTGDGWTDCTGTIDEDGSSVTGVCAESGCAFGMTAQ